MFDLDDTLRVSDPHPHDAFTEFVSELGFPLSDELRKNALRWGHSYWANSTALLDDYEKHNGYEDPFWQNYTRRHLESLGIRDQEMEDIAPLVHSYMGKEYQPESKLVPNCLETLAQLRDRGLYVGLLTNRSRPIYKEMMDLGLDLHLDLFLTAGQMDAFKPDAKFFTKALEMLKVSAQESVYVGDNYFADIQGAEKAHLLPVLIDPKELYPENPWPTIRSIDEILGLLETKTSIA